jgi:hypothetical protein
MERDVVDLGTRAEQRYWTLSGEVRVAVALHSEAERGSRRARGE